MYLDILKNQTKLNHFIKIVWFQSIYFHKKFQNPLKPFNYQIISIIIYYNNKNSNDIIFND